MTDAVQTLVAQVSPYSVDGTVFTSDIFTALKAIAQAKMDAEPVAIPSALQNLALALLVVHEYECKMGVVIAARAGETVKFNRPGETAYLVRYREIVDRYGTEKTSGEPEHNTRIVLVEGE